MLLKLFTPSVWFSLENDLVWVQAFGVLEHCEIHITKHRAKSSTIDYTLIESQDGAVTQVFFSDLSQLIVVDITFRSTRRPYAPLKQRNIESFESLQPAVN
jgi:hypothetical protein